MFLPNPKPYPITTLGSVNKSWEKHKEKKFKMAKMGSTANTTGQLLTFWSEKKSAGTEFV